MLAVVFHTPVNTPLEIFHIFRILAHALPGRVGNFGHIHAVAGGGLHDDIQGRNLCIICNVGADSEGNLCLILKISI